MADINTLVLSGRLTRDSELTYTESGIAILKFSLANNRRMKKNNEWIDVAQYFECIIFSKKAESLNAYLKKGKSICVSGSLKYDSWQDKNTGDKRSKVSVLIDNVQMFGQGTVKVDRTSYDSNLKEGDHIKDVDLNDSFDEDIPF